MDVLKNNKELKQTGYRFRRNQIYQLGVADCLGNNIDGLEEIYLNMKIKAKSSSRMVFIFECVEKMIKKLKLEVDEKRLLGCFV